MRRNLLFVQRKTDPNVHLSLLCFYLVVLTLSGRFRLLFTSYAGLLVMLSLTDLLLNAGLGAVSLESAQGTVQRLVILNDYVRHRSHLTSLQLLICAQYNCLGIS